MAQVELNSATKTFEVVQRGKGLVSSLSSVVRPRKETVTAVDSISLAIEPGEIVGYMGPNGAGKSTTIKMLTGILTPTSGDARVNDIVPHRERTRLAREIGVVFGQRSRLWWLLPVQDSFEYVKALYGIDDQDYTETLQYLQDRLSFSALLGRQVRTLSLGERMRVEIAAAMLHKPNVLFLDEPTVGLDVVGKKDLSDMIAALNEDRHVTVLLVTHDLVDIERLCHRAIIIDQGRIIWDGRVEDLRNLYGKRRTIAVEYATDVAPSRDSDLELIEHRRTKHVYSLNLDALSVTYAIRVLADAGDIADLTVAETEIEHVVRRIYGGD